MDFKINLLQLKEHGIVAEMKQDIVHISGLANCMNGQLVQIGDAAEGVIVGFDQEYALVLIVAQTGTIKPGDRASSLIQSFSVPVGEGFLGRRVDALAMPSDGRGAIVASKRYPIFGRAPSVLDRRQLTEALPMGVKILDMMIPIGKGQRQLIIGDRMTGKTSIATDAILMQKNTGTICIYCCIGKAEAALAKVTELFDREEVWKYGIIVAATAADSMGKQYLAPYVATSIGEYFMYEKGMDVLVVFDDLTKHAWTYRQMSLLLERSPGRDAYPGDIFYLHSQLVERAARLCVTKGGGSMTHLPIVETLQGDVTGYIPSNTISMTDGQIYMNTTLFGEGFKPAIDVKLSVSRIGSKVQWRAMKSLAGMMRLEYLNFLQLLKLTRVKAGVSAEVEARLMRGKVVAELLKQPNNAPVPMEEQVITLYAFREGFFNDVQPENVHKRLGHLLEGIRRNKPELLVEMAKVKDLTEEIKEGLKHEFARLRNSAV